MDDSDHYKVSCVVEGGKYTGAIVNSDGPPRLGDEVVFGGRVFVITELTELMAPVGDFGFMHATCRFLRDDG